ncbi:hypothetical protein AAY473_031381 [Plecturocebus cupreus]
MPHPLDSTLHLGLPLEGLEGELILDSAAILEQAHSGDIRTNVQELQDVHDELLDLCIVMGIDTAGAVNDENQVCPLVLTGALWGKRSQAHQKRGRAQWLTPVIPAVWEAEVVDHLKSGVQDQPGQHAYQHSETLSLLKRQKISWAWWQVPVIPATWEAEARESLEPRRQRLQRAEITPLHSSLGNKTKTPSQKKKDLYIQTEKSVRDATSMQLETESLQSTSVELNGILVEASLQHFGRPKWVDHLRLGVRDQPGEHGETPSLLKIQKLARSRLGAVAHVYNPSTLGGRGSVTQDQAAALQPGQQSEALSQKKKKKKVGGLGMVAHGYNPNTLGGQGQWIT